jgi:hypothetical protein
MLIHWRSPRVVVLLFVGLFLGCGGKSPAPQSDSQGTASVPDPHDVPITEADVQMPASYAEAIPRIKTYRDTIRTESQGATPAKAHRALDELDIVLNKLPTLARDGGVPKEHWEAINTGARELRNLFNQVHSAIDEERKPDYATVADPIEQAIARLAEFAPAAGN